MDTFGLSGPEPKDMDWVNAQLDDMGTRLYGVYGNVQQAIRDNIDVMSYKLQGIERRARSSINGHLNDMRGRINPSLNAIRNEINNSLDSMRGQVNLLAVQHAPDIPSIPLPPLSPGAPSELARTYSILANRDCSEVVAVPGDLGDWYAMGWIVPEGWLVQEQITARPADIQNILIHWQGPCKTAPSSTAVSTP